ncbi:MAG: GNAT family N-acetyltransferase [Pseudomonadales bacterium]
MQIEILSFTDVQRLEYWKEQWLALFRDQVTSDLSSSYQWLANDFIHLAKDGNRRCYIAYENGVLKGAMVCEPQWYKLAQRLPVPIVYSGSHFVNDFAINNVDAIDTLVALIKAVQDDFPHAAWINFERLTESCFQQLTAWAVINPSSQLLYKDDYSAVFDVSAESFKTFTQSMSSKSKANLRNYERLIDKKVGPVVHELIAQQAGESIDVHFTQFLDIEASGWKGVKGTAIRQLNGSNDFYYSLCKTAAEQGQLRWYKLFAGDQLVAMNMAIHRADDLWIVKTAYNENYRSFSPGAIGITKLLHSAVDDVEISKVRMISNYSWLDRWHPVREIYHGARVFNRNILGKIFLPVLRFAKKNDRTLQ